MSDRGLEGRLCRCARGVNVNPLVVLGGVREVVDPILRYLEPIANGDFLANVLLEFFDGYWACHGVDCIQRQLPSPNA